MRSSRLTVAFKLVSLYGLEVVERALLEIPARNRNRAYLETKRRKLGHLLDLGRPQ